MKTHSPGQFISQAFPVQLAEPLLKCRARYAPRFLIGDAGLVHLPYLDNQDFIGVPCPRFGVIDEIEGSRQILCYLPEEEEFTLVFTPIASGGAGIGRDGLRLFA